MIIVFISIDCARTAHYAAPFIRGDDSRRRERGRNVLFRITTSWRFHARTTFREARWTARRACPENAFVFLFIGSFVRRARSASERTRVVETHGKHTMTECFKPTPGLPPSKCARFVMSAYEPYRTPYRDLIKSRRRNNANFISFLDICRKRMFVHTLA